MSETNEICANLLIAERFNEIRRRRKFSLISKLTSALKLTVDNISTPAASVLLAHDQLDRKRLLRARKINSRSRNQVPSRAFPPLCIPCTRACLSIDRSDIESSARQIQIEIMRGWIDIHHF